MNSHHEKSKSSPHRHHSHRDEIVDQADHVYQEAKKLGGQIYDEGRDRMDVLHGNIKDHSDKIVQKVHDNPLSSLVVAAGVGFILARILKR